jgi:limonene 1,2-monooxygenase
MHIAETREQAYEDVSFGLEKWLYYFREVGALPLAPPDTGTQGAIEAITSSGLAVIGDPDDAIAQLERLEQQSGGYGCFLLMDHNWAEWARKKRSYELIARYVMPRFQGLNEGREGSMKWAAGNRPTFIGAAANAINSEIQKHVKEQQEKGSKEGA